MISFDNVLKDHKPGVPKYSGWKSGLHRLSQQTINQDGSYSCTYHLVKYTYPQSLAEDLERWHVIDPVDNRNGFANVENWYNQLTQEQKEQIKKEFL
jgi:hypothetical protein